jgi:outer membrane lipoprotein-sorting protein
MTAFFSNLFANEPDEDGDISFDTELTITNNTDQPVYQIQYKIWLSDPEGATFDVTDSYEDVFLSPGDGYTISSSGRANQRDLLGDCSSILVRGIGCLARRDFRLLGEVPIPGPGESARLKTSLDLGWSSGPLVVLVSRSATDEEGDIRLEYKALIENTSTQYLKVVTIKGQLVDAGGVEIQNDETEQEVPPETAVFYSSNFYGAKAGQLDGAKAIFSLKALIPVATFDANETTEVGEG